MALTLVEAAKYSNDILQRGVIELFVYDDPILEKLQFKEVKGNGLTYNVENTMSGAAFYAPGDTWIESTQVISKTTAVTTILGGDADVDNFEIATRSDINDLMGEQIDAKTKAMKKAYMDMFFYGYYNGGAGYDAKGFDGLHALIKSQAAATASATIYDNVVSCGTAGTAVLLTLAQLEQAVDLIKGGKADLIVMSKTMRRKINQYLNAVSGVTKTEVQGKTLQTICDIPIAVSDYIINTEDADLSYGGPAHGFTYTVGTAKSTTSDNATTIFCLKFAPEGVCGIQSLPITVERLGSLETKDATRVRIKWYPGLMLQRIIWASKVTGILVTGTVTA